MRRVFLFLCLSALLSAAPLAYDLGEGLSYFRPATSADLENAPAFDAAVLDLRYARGEDTDATALRTWLHARASRRTPVLILVSPETDAPLRQVLGPDALPAGALTLGRAAEGFTPDITVVIDPDAEQQAFTALTENEPAALLADHANKSRHDEAAIVRAHQNQRDEDETTDSAGDPQAAAITDRTLQRAVQLHRGLRALRVIGS